MNEPPDPFASLEEEKARVAHPQLRGADAWRPILPVPADAPPLTRTLLDRLTPEDYVLSNGWRYHDEAGRLLGYAVRFNRKANGSPPDKQVKPVTFCEGIGGRREWRCRSFPAPRPLYGLDRLAAGVDKPVLVVEGEKAADAAAARFPDHVAITSPGGSKAAAKADWTILVGRHVTIWPDADEAGDGYAAEVARLARSGGAASVRVVEVDARFPTGWDLADPLPDGVSDEELRAMLSGASATGPDAPFPLYPPLPRPEPYPVDALGPMLSPAAAAIARKVQVPVSMAAQSVLAAASIAAQAHADVQLPFGQTRPLSLYLVTIAASGDRKSTSDNEALWPIRRREKALKEQCERELADWTIDHSAWSAEKRKIEANRKLDLETRKAALSGLGPEPQRPLFPFLTAPDPTVEGLAKAWLHAPASLGIFTAEGGQFIGGHGMSLDNRLKTAATYSELWDGRPIKRIRAMDGVSILDGRRLAMHLMVQPEAAASFLSDSVVRDQGLLSRVLVAAPETIAGTRLYRDTAAADEAAIKSYGARLLAVLEAPWPLVDGQANELEPRVLSISAPAAAGWREFFNHIETQCGPSGPLAPIRDFAAKAAEHAARIAAVLTIVEDHTATEIGTQAMEAGVALADWYITEAQRLHGAARMDASLIRAQQLLDWLQSRDKGVVAFRDILQYGPAAVRTKKAAEGAIGVLSEHGWVSEASARPRQIRVTKG